MVMTLTPLLDLTAEDLMSRDVVTIPEQMSLRDAACLLRRAQVTGAPVVDEKGRCVGVLSAVDFLRGAEEGWPRAEIHPIRSCPYQTAGRLLTGEEAVICTLVKGSCPMQEVRPMTGGRYTAVCLLPPRVVDYRWQALANLPSDAAGRSMTADVVTAGPQTPLAELARMMVDAHIHRIIVIDEQRRPVGIVSSTDILAAVTREGLRLAKPCRGMAQEDRVTGNPALPGGGDGPSPDRQRAEGPPGSLSPPRPHG
jgi:CBS domain-containing membrane protein